MQAVQLGGWRNAAGPVGVIRIQEIGTRTAAEVDRVLDRWDAGAGLVLDLRGNPGGRVEGAVEIAERFLPAGAAVYRWADETGRVATRRARPGRRPRAEPLVVVVDGGTASAAELLAGALATNGRACLAGTRTFGKGRLERLVARAALPRAAPAPRQPAGEYRLPNGDSVERRGLVPDLALATPGEAAAWLAARGSARGLRCRDDHASDRRATGIEGDQN